MNTEEEKKTKEKEKPIPRILWHFSNIIVVVMFLHMTAFTVVMIRTFWKFEAVPDTLIQEYFKWFCVEGGALGSIKVAKVWTTSWLMKPTKTKNKNTNDYNNYNDHNDEGEA